MCTVTGFAAFYFRNASGHYQLKQASQWISGFTHVLRGRFGPPQSVDNLLFYNRTTGRTLLCRIELNRYLLETITAITDFERNDDHRADRCDLRRPRTRGARRCAATRDHLRGA